MPSHVEAHAASKGAPQKRSDRQVERHFPAVRQRTPRIPATVYRSPEAARPPFANSGHNAAECRPLPLPPPVVAIESVKQTIPAQA